MAKSNTQKKSKLSFTQNVVETIRAGFAGIWIRSSEHADAIVALSKLFTSMGGLWAPLYWDADRGLLVPPDVDPRPQAGPLDALTALRAFKLTPEAKEAGQPNQRAILVMTNVNMVLCNAQGAVANLTLLQVLQNAISEGGRTRTHVIILASAGSRVPAELEHQVRLIDHNLPDAAELRSIMESTDSPQNPTLPAADTAESRLLVEAAAGLSRTEASDAYSLSLVRHDKISPEVLWELKADALKKSGVLTLHQGKEGFDMLGGLTQIKNFCLRAFGSKTKTDRNQARGVLLLGPAGTGKSQLAKSLGYEMGRPTVILDIGAVMGKYIGQSEERMREALAQVDMMSPCILFVDEIEKALSGVGGGANDSGVSDRLFGSLLTWMNDHESSVFFICTCNDVSKLPPEFTRAERFDAIVFLDLPGREQREKIWPIYIKYFGLRPEQAEAIPNDNDWTGAEIKACCRLASLLDQSLVEVASNIVPVAVTSREKLDKLRAWASGRCLSADYPGIYDRMSDQPKVNTQTTARKRTVN